MKKLAVLLLISASADAPAWDKLERQERCEEFCLECEGGVCQNLFLICCEYFGGSVHAQCGCRLEL